MPAKNIYIALYDRKEESISYPFYADEFERSNKKGDLEKGLTEYLFHTGKSLICDLDSLKAMEEKGELVLVGHPPLVWLGVPLVVDDVVIGVLAVQDYENATAYGETELHLLEFVSSQVAMTIRQRRLEEAERESSKQYRQLEEFGPEGVVVHCEGMIVFINQSAVNLSGAICAEEMLGRPVKDFVHPEYPEIVQEQLKENPEEFANRNCHSREIRASGWRGC